MSDAQIGPTTGLGPATAPEADSTPASATPTLTPVHYALAFSGGGIRSATFCLGLARALAKNGLFSKFSVLSTVSGGGYVGSAIGRLFSDDAQKEQVQSGLADDRSLFLWWLRRNGRFLLPAGVDDAVQAGTGYLRGLLATHWEAGVLAALLSCVVVAPHVLMAVSPRFHGWATTLATPWWSVLLLLLLPATASYFAFWFTRDRDRDSRKTGCSFASWFTRDGDKDSPKAVRPTADLVWAVLTAIVVGLGWWAWLASGNASPEPDWQTASVLIASSGIPAGLLLSWSRKDPSPQQGRVKFTRELALLLKIAVACAVLGLVDVLSWIAAQSLHNGQSGYLFGGLGFTVILALAIRAAIPALQKIAPPGRSVFAPEKLANVLGVLLSLAVLSFWMTAVQWWVFFGVDPQIVAADPPLAGITRSVSTSFGIDAGDLAIPTHELLGSYGSRLLLVMGVLGIYVLASGRNLDQLNRTSLHPFYRSRLARAYVSVGNVTTAKTDDGGVDHKGRFSRPATSSAHDVDEETVEKISDFIEGDDVLMSEYAPDQHGGPLHVVNVCINETRDDRTGAYNADRKGINLAISHKGFECGTEAAKDPHLLGNSTLAQWVAVSGAAVGSGMGSMTRSGIAALTFLTGVRLGFWWDKTGNSSAFPSKYRATLDEWRGRFPGRDSSPLYLSDGGHFDNTGVYALLKRKPDFIVAADCGADPAYAFADVENLIRKARIDYRAQIEFIDPLRLAPGTLPDGLFGTPDSITPAPLDAFLLLARITYEDKSTGALLIVKPRRIKALTIDVAGYSDRDRAFPQQSTGDQFFDESQWESYCELGLRLGAHITDELAAKALAVVRMKDLPVCNACTLPPAVATEGAPGKNPPVDGDRRERIGGLSVTQKVGIGAALSALVAGWQVFQDTRKAAEDDMRQERAAIQTLLEGEKDSKGTAGISLIDRALRVDKAAGADPWSGYERVVGQLDDFGASQSKDAQASAIRRAARAVANRCEQETRSANLVKGGDDATDVGQAVGEMTRGQELQGRCIRVLASLTQPRRGPWERSLADYQDQVRSGPARKDAWGGCRAETLPSVAVHQYDPADQVFMETVWRKAESFGFRVTPRHEPLLDSYDALARQSRFVVDPPPLRRVRILAHPSDANCASYLASELTRDLGILPDMSIEFDAVPALSHGIGEMQLVLAELSSPDILVSGSSAMVTGGTDPSTGPEPSGPVEIPGPLLPKTEFDFAQRRLIYVQFQGDMTRDTVNQLRDQVGHKDDGTPRNASVPPAERVAGRYGNAVRFFRDEDKADAEILAKLVNDFFAEKPRGCVLNSLDVQKTTAKSAPSHLEVWIAPNCERKPPAPAKS